MRQPRGRKSAARLENGEFFTVKRKTVYYMEQWGAEACLLLRARRNAGGGSFAPAVILVFTQKLLDY